MAKLSMLGIFVVCIALVNSVPVDYSYQQADTSSTQCSIKECRPQASQKFTYDVGKTYVYKYETDTLTTLQGSVSEGSSLHLRCDALVEVLSPCEFSLALRDVSLLDSDPSDYASRAEVDAAAAFRRQVEASPLRFSYQDGVVEEVCPAPDEPHWVTNIKRAAVSAFQVGITTLDGSAQRVHETDVAGRCHSDYSVEVSGVWDKETVVRSEKDLLSCTERTDSRNLLQTDSYHVNSDVQTLPVMNSTQWCEQTIRGGLLVKSYCKERHVFRPFSNYQNGAVTKARQVLEYVDTRDAVSTRMGRIHKRSTLLYEHKPTEEENTHRMEQTEAAFRDICEASESDVRPEVPQLFTRVVYNMRRLSVDALKQFYRRLDTVCRGNTKARKFYFDALPMVGSSASIRVMSELIVSNEVQGKDADMWLMSLAFVQSPHRDMIQAVTPLLEQREPTRQTILAVSALVHSYCRVETGCEREPEVREVLRRLERGLGSSCQVRDKSHADQVIVTLKALGNIGRTTALSTITGCFTSKETPVEIRLAAIETFRRFPCQAERAQLFTVYQEQEEDTEVRIAAFRAVMKCPTPQIVEQVKRQLENEVVNQVGSYVWTYLTNEQESSDPCKRQVRDLLADTKLQSKFSSDVRKFSRHFEGSVFSHIFNTGGHAEGDLIFSPESFIPRSAMLNLTVDLFGSTMNLLEIGGRVQGMEYLMESFFGPNGYFSGETKEEITNELSENTEVRAPIMEQMHNNYGLQKNEPAGSLYLKVFGNELQYWNFRGLEKKTQEPESFNLIELLMKLSREHDIEYTKSFMFLDSTYIIPTVTGMPLNLTINGTATVNLKVGGKVDMRRLMRSPRSAEIDGHIRPSGAVEISSMMSVDAFVARTGLKMVATLHSSTEVDGKLQVRNGEVFSVDFNSPRDRQEIFDLQTKFYVVRREHEREQRPVSSADRGQYSACTGNTLEKWLGVRTCVELDGFKNNDPSAPYYPLGGPHYFKVYLDKADRTMTGYHFESRLQDDRRDGSLNALITFNTPESQIDREWTANLKLDKNDQEISMNLKSPFKTFRANAKIANEESLRRGEVEVILNDNYKYSAHSELKIDQTPATIRYTPDIKISWPNANPITLSGFTSYSRRDGKYEVDLALLNMFSRPMSVKGEVSAQSYQNARKFTGDVSFKSQFFDTKFDGYAQVQSNGYSGKLDIDYTLPGCRPETVKLVGKYNNRGDESNIDLGTNTEIYVSAYPEYNNKLDWDFKHTNEQMENNVVFQYGSRFNRDDTITVHNVFKNEGRPGQVKFEVSTDVTYPSVGVAWSARMEHENTDSMVNNKITGTINGQSCNSLVHASSQPSQYVNVKTEARLTCGRYEYSVVQNVEEKQAKEYYLESSYQWATPENKVTLEGMWKNKNTGTTVDQEIRGELMVPRQHPITINGKVEGTQQKATITGEVNYDGEKYSGHGQYEVKGEYGIPSNVHSEYHATLKLEHPKHQLDSEVTIVNQPSMKDVKVNVKVDNTRDITGQVKVINLPERKNVNLDVNIDNERHITGLVDMDYSGQKKTGKIDFRWDADRDEAKRFTYEAEYKSNYGSVYGASQGEGKFSVEYPPSDVNVRGSYSMQSQGHWPRNGRYNTKAKIEWAQGKKIEVNTNLASSLLALERQDVKNFVEIRTPFNGYEQFELNFTHKVEGKRMNCHVDYKLNDQRSKVSVDAETQWEDGVTSKVHVKTPNYDISEVLINVQHKHEGVKMIDSHVDMQLNRNKRVDVDIKHKVGNGYYGNDIDSQISMKSPYEGMEDLGLKVNYKPRSPKHSVEGELKWAANKKISVNADHSYEAGNPARMNSQVSIDTPYDGYRRIEGKVNHEQSNNQVDSKFNVNWDNNNKIATDISGKYQPGRQFDANVNVQTPYSSLENVNFVFNHRRVDSDFRDEMELKWSEYEKINVEYGGWYQEDPNYGYQLKGNFSINTPYPELRHFETFVSSQYNSGNTGKLSANVETQWSRWNDNNKKVTLNVNGYTKVTRNERHIDGSVTFNSPFRNFEYIRALVKHDSQPGLINNRGEFQWSDDKKIVLDQKVTYSGASDNLKVNGVAHFTSPFRYIDDLTLTVDHEHSHRKIDSDVTFQWESNKKITTSVNFRNNNGRNSRDMEVSAKYMGPFTSFRRFQTKLTHKDDRKTFNSVFETEWNRDEKFTLNSNWAVETEPVSIDGKVAFTSTFRRYEYLGLNAVYHPQRGDHFARLTLERTPRRKVDITAQFDTVSDDEHKVVVKFDSNLRQLPTEVEVGGNLRRKNERGVYDYGVDTYVKVDGEEINFVSKLRGNTATKVTADITFTSPFEGFEKLEFDVGHEYTREGCNADFTVQWSPSQQIAGNWIHKQNRVHYLEEDISLTTPFTNFENLRYKLLFKHEKPWYTAETSFQWAPRQQIKLDGKVRSDSDELYTYLNFYSPFDGFEKITYSGSIDNKRGDYKTTIDFKMPRYAPFALQTTFEIPNFRYITGTLSLDSDIPYLEHIRFNGKYETDTRTYKSNVLYQWNTQDKVTFDGVVKLMPSERVEISFNGQTPFAGYEKFSAEGEYNKKFAGHSLKGWFQDRNSEKYEIEGDMEYTSNLWAVNGNIKTPVESVKNIGFKHKCERQGEKYVCEVSFAYAQDKVIDLVVDFTNQRYKREAHFKFTSPCPVVNPIEGMVMYEMPKGKYHSSAWLQYGSDRYELDTNVQKSTGYYKLDTVVKTPYAGYETMEYSAIVDVSKYKEYKVVSTCKWSGGQFVVNYLLEVKGGCKSDLRITTPFTGYESLQVLTDYVTDTKKLHVVVEYATGKKIDFTFDLSRYRGHTEVQLRLLTPFRDWENMYVGAKMEEQSNSYKPRLEVNWGTKDAKIVVEGEFKNHGYLNYDADINIVTPIRKWESTTAKFTNRYVEGRFTNNILITYFRGSQQISSDLEFTYKSQNSQYDSKLTIRTPYNNLRELVVEFDHEHSDRHYNTTAALQYNQERIFDLKLGSRDASDRVTYRRSYDAILRNIYQPVAVKVNYETNVDGCNVQAEVNPDLRANRRPYRVEGTYKHVTDRERYVREVSITTQAPSRTMMGQAYLARTQNKINNKVELCWDHTNDRKVSYDFEVEDKTGERKEIDSVLKLRHPLKNVDVVAHYVNKDGKYVTEVVYKYDLSNSRKVARFNIEHVKQGNGESMVHKTVITVQHPALEHDITIRSDLEMFTKSVILSNRLVVDYSRDGRKAFVSEVKVVDENRGARGTNYTLHVTTTHQPTGVDVKLSANYGYSAEKITAGGSVAYQLSRQSPKKTYIVTSVVNKEKQKVTIQVVSPSTTFAVSGSYEFSGSELVVDVEGQRDNGQPVRGRIQIQTEPVKHVDVKLYMSDESNMYEISGGWLNTTSFRVEANHVQNGARHQDGYLGFNLDSKNWLRTRLNWRPNMYFQVSDHLRHELGRAQRELLPEYYEAIRSVEDEAVRLYRSAERHLNREMGPLMDELKREARELEVNWDELGRQIVDGYYNNEFYSKDMYDLLEAAVSYTHKYYRRFSEDIERLVHRTLVFWDAYVERVKGNLNYVVDTMGNYALYTIYHLGTLTGNSYNYVSDVNDQINNKVEEYKDYVRPHYEKYSKMYGDYSEMVDTHMDRFKKSLNTWKVKVQEHPYYESASSQMSEIKSRALDYYDHSNEYIDQVKDTAKDYINEFGDYADQFKNFAKRSVRDLHYEIMKQDDIRGLQRVVEQAVENGRRLWREYDMAHKVEEIYQALENTAEFYWDAYYKYLVQKLKQGSQFSLYDLTNGDIEHSQFLPIEWDDLTQLPQIYKSRAYAVVRKVLDKYLPEKNMTLWDVYYRYKPSSDVNDWVPPFKGHAYLIGDQHYVTFDHSFYEFVGECSYVLAHDFQDGNFTVVVNYNNQKRKSLTVYVGGKSVEIFSDYRVKVDESSTELPVQVHTTSITRTNAEVRVDNSRGVTVTCNWVRDYCRVNMSGWYFGKTAGLLGTYDNEPSTDFTTSDHRLVKDQDTFTASWNVRQGCRSRTNSAKEFEVGEQSKAYKMCADVFANEGHEFRYCHKEVSPQHFMDMCIIDVMSARGNNFEKAICSSAAAYRDECKTHGVSMNMPRECVTCEGADGSTTYPDSVTEMRGSEVPQIADVVFVVEEKESNRRYVADMKEIARDVESSLRKEGITNNRYAVVGYGGADIHEYPHTHTSGGQQWFTSAETSKAFDSLEFDDENDYNDAFAAIDFAVSEYHFRAGASKTIVLISKSGCSAHGLEEEYADMHSLLIENDFTLHVLLDQDLAIKSKKSRKNYVIGFDAGEAYTVKDSRDREMIDGDDALYHQIRHPKDMCVALAQETNGTMFSVPSLVGGGGARQGKRALNVFSRRVAQTARPATCQYCSCVMDGEGMGTTECRPCVTPKPATVLKAERREMQETTYEASRPARHSTQRPRRARKNKAGRRRRNRNN